MDYFKTFVIWNGFMIDSKLKITMEKKAAKSQASKEMRDPKSSKEEKSQAAKTLSGAAKKTTKK